MVEIISLRRPNMRYVGTPDSGKIPFVKVTFHRRGSEKPDIMTFAVLNRNIELEADFLIFSGRKLYRSFRKDFSGREFIHFNLFDQLSADICRHIAVVVHPEYSFSDFVRCNNKGLCGR